MITTIVDIFLWALLLYLLAGVVFSVFFYLRGAQRLDAGTKDTPWHFKLIIFPGVVLFWIVLFTKLVRNND